MFNTRNKSGISAHPCIILYVMQCNNLQQHVTTEQCRNNIVDRAVASMYSWGGVSQKFPNDEENFRIFHRIRSHEGVCYPENEDAIYKQKYT